jgi:hypothetical protein
MPSINAAIRDFSIDGWKSDDAEKTKWLIQMSDRRSSSPTVSPAIRVWLEAHCELLSFSGPGEIIPSNLHRNLSPEHA